MSFKLKFKSEEQKFETRFDSGNDSYNMGFGEIQTVTEIIGGDEYLGDYVIKPKVEEQIIQTKRKVLLEDLTIKGIEIHRVKNSSGGTTVYIARGD